MESAAATRNCSMKVIPSIAFGEFSGSAGDVTARSIGGRTILNHKAYQAKTKTPAQAVSRNTLSKVSRAYKQLTDSQMKAWGALAEHLKGISTFGKAAEMTAHNAFVRINANRSLVNMPTLEDAPDYINDVPEVDYDDFWVTPTHIVFTELNTPSDHHVLVFKMSPALSPGVSSGWGKTVIVEPGATPVWDEVDATEKYTEVVGFAPEYGKKYFCEFWWMDKETGFTGEAMVLSAICKDGSTVHNKPYAEMMRFGLEDTSDSYRSKFTEFDLIFSGDNGIACFEAKFANVYSWSYNGFKNYFEHATNVKGQGYMCMRSEGDNKYRCDLMFLSTSEYEDGEQYEFSVYTDSVIRESFRNGIVFGTVAVVYS